MRAKNFLLFIISSGIAFIAFAAIALAIESTGLVRMNASRPLPTATSIVSIPAVRNTPIPLPPNATLIPTFTALPNVNNYDWEALLNELNDEEREWLALGIDDYHIEVSVSGTWVSHSVTVEVRAGEIVQNSVECGYPKAENGECLFVRPVEEYIVPFLFNTVRNLPVWTENFDAVVSPEVNYDAYYHIPTLIIYSPINILDAGVVYEVLSFEPLP